MEGPAEWEALRVGRLSGERKFQEGTRDASVLACKGRYGEEPAHPGAWLWLVQEWSSVSLDNQLRRRMLCSSAGRLMSARPDGRRRSARRPSMRQMRN